MSNLSLKEQLEALSLGNSSSDQRQQNRTNKPIMHSRTQSEGKRAKQKTGWLELAQYGVELLRAYFPRCFKEVKEIQPLKIGIKQDLVKYLSQREDIVIGDKACMVNSLAYYVNSMAYHKSVTADSMRIDLDGQDAGRVTAEEARYSADCRKAKFQKKQSANVTGNDTIPMKA